MMNKLPNEFKKMAALNKNDPLLKYLSMVQEIVMFNRYDIKPYLNTNQNQEYMRKLITQNVEDAFVILGSGDSIFQLLLNDVYNITAVDINELQKMIFSLKKVALKTLSLSDYEKFLIDRDGVYFLSKEIFKYAEEGFTENETFEHNFWKSLFYIIPNEELKNRLFKGGVEACTIEYARSSLQFIKKNRLYFKVRENLEKANIVIKTGDFVETLLNDNSDSQYDYIDLTNILLFVCQKLGKDKFKEYISKIEKIYNSKLRENGTIVLDYLFGIDLEDLKDEKDMNNMFKKIYHQSTQCLQEKFNLESFKVDAIPGVINLHGKNDTLIYTKKMNN